MIVRAHSIQLEASHLNEAIIDNKLGPSNGAKLLTLAILSENLTGVTERRLNVVPINKIYSEPRRFY